MRINEISILNFKGISNCTFKFQERFTVFIGENATGKTTILDALSVALGSFFIGIEGVSSRSIQPSEVRLLTIDGQPRPQKPVLIEAVGVIDNQKIIWQRSIANKKTSHKDAKDLSDVANFKLTESRKPRSERIISDVVFPVIAYHGTGRLWAEHEKVGYQKQNEGVIKAYTNSLSAKSSSKEFISWFKTQEDSIKKFGQELDISHLRAFKEVILSMVPDERWTDMTYDYKEDALVGIFQDSAGVRQKLSFNQLSDGYRNLIGIAADIAYRCIQLNPQLGDQAVKNTPGVVLIDEIDLHLHPNWQKRIVLDLKSSFPLVQFVATTHSPFIVQSLRESELINLDNRHVDNSPNELPLAKVATSIMGVTGIRSDEYEKRVSEARQELSIIRKKDGELTLDAYKKISMSLGKMLVDETDDPEYKAFLIEAEGDNDNATD